MQRTSRVVVHLTITFMLLCTIAYSETTGTTPNKDTSSQAIPSAQTSQQPSPNAISPIVKPYAVKDTTAGKNIDSTPTTAPIETDKSGMGTADASNNESPVNTSITEAKLKLFGQDFFSNSLTTFEPNPDTPVPSNYTLGAGDQLSVICGYGANEYENNTVTITPNGAVYLKLLNTVPLAGKTLAQAENDLRKAYSRYYAKFNLVISVVNRRSIPVYVMGEVVKPGKYFVSSLATVFTALYAAGGPTDLGSLRSIRVMRDQKVIGSVDVYTYLLKGQLADIPLKEGDTIFVPLAKKIVTVKGEVRRPALYEVLDTDTLSSAIDLAGGTSANSVDRITLSRVDAQRERHVQDLRLPKDLTAALQDGDEISIGAVLPYLQNAVTIEGEINRPGAFPLDKVKTIADLITLADGVTPDAYLLQAQLYRYSLLTGETQLISIDLTKALVDDAKENIALRPMDRLVISSRKQINDLYVTVEGTIAKPGKIPFYNKMKVSDAIFQAGGIDANAVMDRALLVRRNPQDLSENVTDISLRGALSHTPESDLPLNNGDRLVVYPKAQLGARQFVTVNGAVITPGDYPYLENMRVSQLLLMAKGLKNDAYTSRAELYRLQADHSRTVIPIDLSKAAQGGNTDDNPILQATDRLVIASINERMEKPMVKVGGYVRSPNSFPLTNGMKLSDLLYLGGGLKPDAEPVVELYRHIDNKIDKMVYPVKSTADGRFVLEVDPILQADDLISVRGNSSYAKNIDTISIEGEVKSPGAFPAYDGTRQAKRTLYQVLTQAGGLLPEAYASGVVLYRQQSATYTVGQQWELAKTTRNMDSLAGVTPPSEQTDNILPQPKDNQDLIDQADHPLATTVGGAVVDTTSDAVKKVPVAQDVTSENANRIANSIAQVISTGKDSSVVLVIAPRSMQMQQFSLSLPVDAERLLKTKGKEGDVVLEPDDIVYVPKRPTTVTVIGGVITNGSVLYRSKMMVKDYLDSVGGIAPDGNEKHIVIMHVNGQISPAKRVKSIQPGDIIIVPTKHIVQSVHTGSNAERYLNTISQLALSVLPFIK